MKVRYITVITEVRALNEIGSNHSISGFGTDDALAGLSRGGNLERTGVRLESRLCSN